MPPPHTISVELDDRSYPIVIGSGLIGEFDLTSYLGGGECLVVTDETVAPLYLDRLRENPPVRGAESLSLPAGESAKTLGSVERVIDRLVGLHAGRDATVIALGGGVVGDIAGFAAACYMRGIAFLQVPTTLLAQVDSSVGGKTGVNHREGKNLIGAFHQPRAVLIDTDLLDTLPERELKAGLAEVIKHAAIADAEFFGWLEENVGALLQRDAAALRHAIRRSCEIKAAVVAADETERGQRALLNFGHTFAHAIETTLGYGAWLHGEAVAAGMIMAAALSGIDPADEERLRRLVAAAGLPAAPPEGSGKKLLAAMQTDKKAKGGKLRFVLLRGLGRAVVTDEWSQTRLDGLLGR